MTVDLKDINLTIDPNSIKRDKISDAEYFSEKYSDYISNSRLKLINPSQDGNPLKYKNGFSNDASRSLILGTAIHQLYLEREEFYLVPHINKPSSKLGLVIDSIYKYRLRGHSIDDAIMLACKEVNYYSDSISPKRIKTIIKSGLEYYYNLKSIIDDNAVILSERDRLVCEKCLNNLNVNEQINRLMFPEDSEFYNEDAFFATFKAQYNDKEVDLKFKMKIDNWSINQETFKIRLNDLKTTGHMLGQFREKSIIGYHYGRQIAAYLYILLEYCKKTYDYDDMFWTYESNIVAVETSGNNEVGIFRIFPDELHKGIKEFYNLLKMVAYCEMYEYSNNIKFVCED